MSVVDATSPASDERLAPLGRCLLVLWQHPTTRLISPVGLLAYDHIQYTFGYIRGALDVADFRPLIGFDDLHHEYRSSELFPIFAQRAMDPRRRDYVRFVERLGIEADATPWEQIARSGGRRPGDTLQLLPVPVTEAGVISLSFMVNGIRHVTTGPVVVRGTEMSTDLAQLEERIAQLVPGSPLVLEPQPENQHNPEAILVMTPEGEALGWVPDVLVHDLQALRRSTHIDASCEVANAPDAPWHLRLLVRAEARPGTSFAFFQDERFDRLAGQ